MSKIITQRLDYVMYDDAAGILIPSDGKAPTYPPTIDQYSTQSIATSGSGYGVLNVNQAAAALPATVVIPSGANLLLVCPVANTATVAISFAALQPAPDVAVTSNVTFLCAPGQSITIPGPLWRSTTAAGVAAPVTVTTVTSQGLPLTPTVAFGAQILWSL